jgi:hypothetical protein
MKGHTPGPWVVVPNDGAYVEDNDLGDVRIEQYDDGPVIAVVITDIPSLRKARNANAALIASAPSLLEQNRVLREALELAEDLLTGAMPKYAADRNEVIAALPTIRRALDREGKEKPR